MGKQIVYILVCVSMLFWAVRADANPFIPSETLKIARQAKKLNPININSSENVRVGIGNNSFSAYVYKTVGIYGTAPLDIYNDENLIERFGANENVNVTINPDNTYTLTEDDGTEIVTVSGPLRFTSYGGCLGIKGLKRAGRPALYHGSFEIVKSDSGNQFNLINKLGIEEYLRGVVPNEMPIEFGLEALKAQSIAARNYVLSPRIKSSANYDVVDSVASQVYFGANTEKQLSNLAVEQTEGLVALYDWDLILAQYSSTAGGYTESYAYVFSDPESKSFPSAGKPYLKAKPDILSQKPLNSEETAEEFYKSKPDAYDIRSPYYRWTREWSAEELKSVLESTLASQSSTGFVSPAFSKGDKLDDIAELKVKRRGDSGKIVELEIITTSNTYKVYKELIVRRLLTKNGKALPSANVVFENLKDDGGNLVSVKAFGGGFGHGVGMSQYGAGFMGSELNLPYDKILQHYYTGITVGTKPITLSSDSSQNVAAQIFYANEKRAKIVIDNKSQITKLNVNINGKEHTFELPVSLIGGNKCPKIDISDYIKIGRNKIIFSYPLGEGNRKSVRLFVELVEKNDNENIWE